MSGKKGVRSGAIRVTFACGRAHNERQINEIGLKPDYEVKMADEDIKAGFDAQLDKANELFIMAK